MLPRVLVPLVTPMVKAPQVSHAPGVPMLRVLQAVLRLSVVIVTLMVM